METKVAVNDMTRVRLMESPGPGHGHRGFLVQRNHEFGEIVIAYRLPERCDSGNSAISTFYNRDIFTIPKLGRGNFQIRPLADKPGEYPRAGGNVPRNENGIITKTENIFRPQRVSPDMGVPGLSD